MAATRNLCAQIPTALHEQVCEAREAVGLTTAQYITNLLIEYYEMKKNGGNQVMANNNTRTMAFQIGEDLFLRIKAHLERETARTGRKLTQREFVLGLIEEALNEAEQQAAESNPEPEEQPNEEAGVSPCEAQEDSGDPQVTPACCARKSPREATQRHKTNQPMRSPQSIPNNRDALGASFCFAGRRR